MQTHPLRHNRSRSDTLHPRVYQAVAALALWLVLSIWLFFSAGSYTSLTLTVVSGFILVAVGLPLILSRVGQGLEHDERAMSFHDWIHGDFSAWEMKIGGAEAATQVLLPIAAVSIGMTLIGLVFYLAVPAAG
jgi:hypothetical protein